MRQRLTVEEYTKGILSFDRVILSRAITVIESKLPSDRVLGKQILSNILPHTGKSIRIGITGVPGVGKSTFIETFGKHLTSLGKRVGVLTIDPSSKRSGGSILGDKTRMEQLAHDELAYIRPSATGLTLGGVANSTRETLLLCEAAGFQVMIIETVGVGQSETLVHGMTDFFLLLMLAGAGDELQGIKKGIMEIADAVVFNKADGPNKTLADQAVEVYRKALHLLPKTSSGHSVKIMTCSALKGTGIPELWETIVAYQKLTLENGYFTKNRQAQNLDWMHDHIRKSLEEEFYRNEKVKHRLSEIENRVMEDKELPNFAAQQLLDIFLSQKKKAK
jgi:LAO/AO transport system kinase